MQPDRLYQFFAVLKSDRSPNDKTASRVLDFIAIEMTASRDR